MHSNRPFCTIYRLQVLSSFQADGVVAAKMDLDHWLNDSLTWRNIGDKCALLNLYALASDLYAQGLMRDGNAFRKNKIWYGYAKANFRCGKRTDATLAVKVSAVESRQRMLSWHLYFV
jgi:hypothetical protein